jgi:hypothetical protein
VSIIFSFPQDVEVKGKDDSHDATKNEELPRRSIAPGLSMGLSVMLNLNEEEYYCTGTESIGFKVGTLILSLYIYLLSFLFLTRVFAIFLKDLSKHSVFSPTSSQATRSGHTSCPLAQGYIKSHLFHM